MATSFLGDMMSSLDFWWRLVHRHEGEEHDGQTEQAFKFSLSGSGARAW